MAKLRYVPIERETVIESKTVVERETVIGSKTVIES